MLSLRSLRALMDGLPGAVLGGAVYGAWAIAANWDAGGEVALRAGLAHWCTSALLTYFGTAVMRRLYGRPANALQGALRACSGGLALTYAVLVSVHLALGTPHVALTLTAGVLPNLAFCATYALLLARTMPLRTTAPMVDEVSRHG
jgi:hypothetical protein